MESGFVHTAQTALADSFTADQVPGNRLEVLRDVTVYRGYPGSTQTETWKAGFITPPVYSWVQQNGNLYWMIGELAPIRYVQHNKNDFKIRADYGGGKYLEDEKEGFFNFGFGNLEENLKDTFKVMLPVLGIGAGLYLLAPMAPVLIRKLTQESE